MIPQGGYGRRMARPGKKLVRLLRSVDCTDEVDEYELLILAALAMRGRPGREPRKLAKGLGLRKSRVIDAWTRLRDKGLIEPVPETDEPEPRYQPSTAGRKLAGDALMALELSGYEPAGLKGMRESERRHPFTMKREDPWL